VQLYLKLALHAKASQVSIQSKKPSFSGLFTV
jgi:hypothetical protein